MLLQSGTLRNEGDSVGVGGKGTLNIFGGSPFEFEGAIWKKWLFINTTHLCMAWARGLGNITVEWITSYGLFTNW